MLKIADLIRQCKAATKGRFSDMHLREKDVPRLRTSNGLEPASDEFLEKREIYDFIEKMRPDLRFDEELDRNGGEFDFGFELDGDNYRANLARYNGHKMIMLVMRKLDRIIRSLPELGLPESLLKWLDHESGLVFVVGPTGSGKTSTLAAFVEHLNRTKPIHILTAEDPIEIRFEPMRATITQREIGQDTSDFASAARAAMREDPDVMLIGEIRDLASAKEAIRLAETGHLVLSTLHADSADGAIDRLARIFEGSAEQTLLLHSLAAQLVGVLYQRLLVSKQHDQLGLPRRVLAYEMITNTPPVATHIRENKIVQIRGAIQMSGHQENMAEMSEVLNALLAQNLIDPQTAQAAATRRDTIFERVAHGV
jgi:twitching motility protein PilT